MKRKLFSALALFLAVGALTSFASTDNNDKKCDKPCAKQKCEEKKCDKDRNGQKAYNPFEGITLTADQQSKLDALRADRPDPKAFKDKASKADKQNKDQKQARPDRRQIRRDYLAKVKEILTPDQYVIFLENSVVNAPSMRPGKNMGHHKMGHDGRRPNHGEPAPRN